MRSCHQQQPVNRSACARYKMGVSPTGLTCIKHLPKQIFTLRIARLLRNKVAPKTKKKLTVHQYSISFSSCSRDHVTCLLTSPMTSTCPATSSSSHNCSLLLPLRFHLGWYFCLRVRTRRTFCCSAARSSGRRRWNFSYTRWRSSSYTKDVFVTRFVHTYLLDKSFNIDSVEP